jgi:hypothetical protein
MLESTIQKIHDLATAQEPYIIRQEKMGNSQYLEDKQGYQDFVENRLYEPISATDLAQLKQEYPMLPEALWQFYRLSNGASFLADIGSSANQLGGFFFLPFQMWRGEEVKWLTSWISMDDEEYETDLIDGTMEIYGIPPWLPDILVLGGFEAGPERFYMPTTGEFSGHVMMFQHDEHRNYQVSESFDAFLNLLANYPADLIQRCGGHFYYDMIAYGDSKQYIPLSEPYLSLITMDDDYDDDNED